MNYIDTIKDKSGKTIFPKTLTKAVYEEGTGRRLDDILNDVASGGGLLETYTEKLVTIGGTAIINLDEGNVFVDEPTVDRTYNIANVKSGVAHSFTLQINMGRVRTLVFPDSVRWQDGIKPDFDIPNKIYLLTFMTTDRGANWLGMYGGEF